MTDVFGTAYSQAYDAFYAAKDYDAECRLLTRFFHEHPSSIRSILDLGCGTGGHAIRLARQGYEVLGVDRSETMIQVARAKAGSMDLPVQWHQSEIAKLDLARTFDAAIIMFAVLGYHTKDDDVLSALQAVRRHVKHDGLLIFDVWYGPSVLSRPTERKCITASVGRETWRRTALSEVDLANRVCRVRFSIAQLSNGIASEETTEDHTIRFFFETEIREFLHAADFSLIALRRFPSFDGSPDAGSRDIVVVASPSSNLLLDDDRRLVTDCRF